MGERYDYNKIPGSNNMSARDKRYFSKFGNRMADQAEVIVNNHNLDSETMKEEYILLMNNLVSDPAEYIVEGAPLACTLQTNVVQKVSYKGMSLFSVPREKNRDENTKIEETEAVTPPSTMSTLRIPDENRITFAGYVPATVTDAKGGLRDVKPTVSQEKNDVEKDEEGLNIVSFGNCQGVNNDTPIEVLAQELYTSIRGRGGNITLTEIEEKMKLAIEKGKGVCYCAMMLNSEWENLPLGYDFRTETYENTNSGLNQFSVGIDQAFSRTYQMFNGKEGINMMSMIFCTRGGIVAAKESGQVKGVYETSYEFKYDWAKEGLPNAENVTQEFLEKVVEIAKKLEINPDDLLAVMAFESRFNPNAENSSGAYGLIQFTDSAIAEINRINGTNYQKSDIKAMDIIEQLDLVYLHYKSKTGLMKDLGDVYLVTFAPKFVNGEINGENTVLYSRESSNENYEKNKGLDKEGKGYITKGDAVQAVLDRREEYIYE